MSNETELQKNERSFKISEDQRIVFNTILDFAERHKGSWKEDATSHDFSNALEEELAPLQLPRKRKNRRKRLVLDTHNGESLITAVSSFMKHCARDKNCKDKRRTFFDQASDAVDVAYLAAMGRQLPTFRSPSSERTVDESSKGHDTEVGQKASLSAAEGSSGVSGVQSLPKQDKPSVQDCSLSSAPGYGRREGLEQTRLFYDIASSCSKLKVPRPSKRRRSIRSPPSHHSDPAPSILSSESTLENFKRQCTWEGLERPPATCQSNVIKPIPQQPTSAQDISPYFSYPLFSNNGFGIQDEKVEKVMKRIYRLTESAVDEVFSVGEIKDDQPADFETSPTSDLRELYEAMFEQIGAPAWEEVALQLQVKGTPTARDTLIGVVNAAIHLWCLSRAQTWQGPSRVSFASDLHREHVINAISQYTQAQVDIDHILHIAAQTEIRHPKFREQEITPKAQESRRKLNLVLSQHLRRLRAASTGSGQSLYGGKWCELLDKAFIEAHLLEAEIGVANVEYIFEWYKCGVPFKQGDMEPRYNLRVNKKVAMTLHPSVSVVQADLSTLIISKARVIVDNAE